eukprot:jgi/Tetstr1/447939/TSEL_035245.t1
MALNVVGGLLAALGDTRLEAGLAAAAKAHATAQFKKERQEDPYTTASRKIKDKTAREKRERERREAEAKNKNDKGKAMANEYIMTVWRAVPTAAAPPRLRLNATPRTSELAAMARNGLATTNAWRFITDLRVLNTYRVRKRLRMETLMGVRHLIKIGGYMFSFDLQDGFYALGIAPLFDQDYGTVNIRNNEMCYRSGKNGLFDYEGQGRWCG